MFDAGASLLESKLKKGLGANILFICTSALWQVGMQKGHFGKHMSVQK